MSEEVPSGDTPPAGDQLPGDLSGDVEAPSRRRRKWIVISSLVALMALVGGGAAVVVVSGDDDYPTRWHPRVRKFVEFVEEERGLKFRHPIAVEFLSDKSFGKSFKVSPNAQTDEEDPESDERTVELLRALGLVDEDFKLSEVVDQIGNEAVLGFYEFETRRIKVRGTRLSPEVRATLVHELTHALQAQHFSLAPLEDESRSTEQLAFTTLLEGDANRVENAYVNGFSEDEFDQYSLEQESSGEEADLSGIPTVFTTILGLPYSTGDLFIEILKMNGGDRRIDRAFRSPPKADEHILDPYTYLRGDKPESVALPKLRSGEQRVEEEDDESFGAVTWLFMLGERIDANLAVRAADGWGGDSSIVFTKETPDTGTTGTTGNTGETGDDGNPQRTTCVRAGFRGETRRDTAEMLEALRVWKETMPVDTIEINEGRVITLTACDPGVARAAKVTGNHVQVFTRYLSRIVFTSQFVEGGGSDVPVRVARCVADRLIAGFTNEQIASDNVEDLGPDFEEKAALAFSECSGAPGN